MAEPKRDQAGNRCDDIFELPSKEDGTPMTVAEVQEWVKKNIKKAVAYYHYSPEHREIAVTYQFRTG
jgi:hypothetical protein